MTAVGVGHIAAYGRNIPLSEDWHLVRPLTGAEPSFWGWVWAQNNEHRLPVARLVYLGLLEVACDFRSGAVFDTLLMAAVAAALVLLARRLRGRTSLVDAAFPLLLLHPGNWENLFWSWQMQFVVVAAMTLVLLAAVAGSTDPPSKRTTWVAAAMVVLLPLGGGTALPLVPFAIAALLVLAWSADAGRSTRRVAGAASVLAVVETGLYFVGWKAATWYPDNPGPPETLETTGKLLALAWGPAAHGRYTLIAVLTAAVLVPAVVLLVRAVRQAGPDRRPALALGLHRGHGRHRRRRRLRAGRARAHGGAGRPLRHHHRPRRRRRLVRGAALRCRRGAPPGAGAGAGRRCRAPPGQLAAGLRVAGLVRRGDAGRRA